MQYIYDEDKSFAEVAIRIGICSLSDIQECFNLQQRVLAASLKPKRLEEILLQKGIIKQTDIEKVRAVFMQNRKIPEQIAGYRLMEKIGDGTTGMVYKAIQLSMDRVVAVKILSPKLTAQPKFREKFLNEIKLAARINHLNIVQGIDAGVHEMIYYFVMEFIDGPSVGALLRRGGALDEKRALTIGRQIADALSYAHQNGIVHRDVKPDNIMINRDGIAKLCDLGLAVVAEESENQNKTISGTPYYISPEQAKGMPVDAKSDMYSFGATLYHMVVGAVPFEASDSAGVVAKHITESVVPPNLRNKLVSKETSDLIVKLMQKDSAKRYAQMKDVVQAIDAILQGNSGRARPPIVLKRRRSRIFRRR